MKGPDIKFANFLDNNFFKGKRNGFFIEAGANTGYDGSVCWYFESSLGWSGMNFECSPYCYSELKKNRPNTTNICKALSCKNGAVDFTMPLDGTRKEYAAVGSIVFDENYWKGRPTKTFNVETVVLSDVITDYDIKYIDLFVLDVEGAEVDVLSGLIDSMVRPKIICLEDDKINMDELKIVMDKLGYTNTKKRYANNGVYKYNG